MKFEDLCGFELKRGNHERPEDGLCVLEALAWFEGEPHSDHPKCVCPVVAHFARSFNDRLDHGRQDLIPYIPKLANTAGRSEVAQVRLRLLAREFAAVGGGPEFAERLEARFARARLPFHASSFGLSIVCDAITLKRSTAECFVILDGLLSIGAPSPGHSSDVPERGSFLARINAG